MTDAGPAPGVNAPLSGDGLPPVPLRGAGMRAPGSQRAADAAARAGSLNVVFGLGGLVADIFWLLPLAVGAPSRHAQLIAGSVCLLAAICGQLALLASSHRIARGLLDENRGVVLGLMLGIGGAGLSAVAGAAALVVQMALLPAPREMAPCCLLLPACASAPLPWVMHS